MYRRSLLLWVLATSFTATGTMANAGQFGLFGDDGRQVGVATVDQATLTISTERGQSGAWR